MSAPGRLGGEYGSAQNEGGQSRPQPGAAGPRTLFDKLWDAHVVAEVAPGVSLLHVDRHLVHDLGGHTAFTELERRGLRVRNPRQVFAVPDHVVSTAPGRTGGNADWSTMHIAGLRDGCRRWGIRLFDVNDAEQGIVHVIGPEQGLTLPGMLLLCGDSHTSTHGAMGALAWGIGASEIVHVLATQTIVQRRPRRMRIRFDGKPGRGVEAKDLILHVIGELGAAGGTGYAVEYAGPAIEAMEIPGRLTLCNLSIEMGAKVGMIAPDERTFAYVAGRPYAPRGELWDKALVQWRRLRTDEGAVFDREVRIDASAVAPQITWGTSPQDVIAIDATVPDPAQASDAERREAIAAALAYMDLAPGKPIAGTRIDRVFIGSCTNSRFADLERAAGVVRGHRVAPHVEAWVVPGSQAVKREAEAAGLDRIFLEAGFQWREPGCSLCVGANGEMVGPGQRCVSTSNRNFVGRQGPGARTHLASPAMAAAAAIAGAITDVRALPE
jgi:3-isopropylmalate/(R)-2-methylmalate dehydratase large subunit